MIEGLTFEAAPEAVTRPLVSLIVPVLNEQDAVIPFVQAIDGMVQSQWPVLEDRPRLEIIFVDDGSTDSTAAVLRGLCAGDKRVKLIQLSRNFGKEAALSAGLKASRGDAVVPMDVDLQDPPELLRPMIDRWQSGVQVVNARQGAVLVDRFSHRDAGLCPTAARGGRYQMEILQAARAGD